MKTIKKTGFSFTEMLIVLVLMGIIAVLYSVGIKLYNPAQKGFDVKSKKTLEGIDQAINLIAAQHSPTFNLEYLNDKTGSFSIADAGVTPRLAALFKEYLMITDNNFASKNSGYYSSPILTYNKTSVGSKLNSLYSEFLMSEDGVIYGFRLYSNCSSNEVNAQPPLSHEKYTVKNICGSIFYDVNAYKKPNKLGSDQYIIPIDFNGTEIKKSL